MSITPTLHFAGKSADSSRTVTPEPGEDRPSSPDSIHSDPETESQLTVAGNTAKDLLKRGAISWQEYDLMTGGLDRAHLEIRRKIDLGRAWQTRSRKLDDDLYETEDQLDAVQRQSETADANLGIIQHEYMKSLNALEKYKLANGQLTQMNVHLKRENARLTQDLEKLKPEEKPAKKASSKSQQLVKPKKLTTTEPEEAPQIPLHTRPLQQRLLIHNKERAEDITKQLAEDASSQ